MVNKVLEDPLDSTYAALADPTRRALLVALRGGDARITDLAAPLPMTFAGVSRHIGVLESAGLVRRTVRGREHWLSIRPEGFTEAESWIREQTAFWSRRADALGPRLKLHRWQPRRRSLSRRHCWALRPHPRLHCHPCPVSRLRSCRRCRRVRHRFR